METAVVDLIKLVCYLILCGLWFQECLSIKPLLWISSNITLRFRGNAPHDTQKPSEHTKIYLAIVTSMSHKEIQAKICRPAGIKTKKKNWGRSHQFKLEIKLSARLQQNKLEVKTIRLVIHQLQLTKSQLAEVKLNVHILSIFSCMEVFLWFMKTLQQLLSHLHACIEILVGICIRMIAMCM